jgi:hypothetical protein
MTPRVPRIRRRWSTEPLFRLTRSKSSRELADNLQVSPRRIERAVVGGLNDSSADEFACRLGFHPAMVWVDWFDAVAELEEAETR